MEPLSIAILGCGSRGRTYAKIAASFGSRYRITAAADPVAVRRETVAALGQQVRVFDNEADFFSAGRLADVLVIATQDAQHYAQAKAALELGYDLLLEKPACETLERCEELHALAVSLGRRIALCFVLRYTPFYATVKQVIDSGKLGRIITIRASEGVEVFHQAHSFVRGHWSRAGDSTPMIVAKCSHDADILCWLSGSGPRAVASFGDLTWFRPENAPPESQGRCTDQPDDVPCCDGIYDSRRYLTDKRRWLSMVMDGADTATDEEIREFLKTSPWGRCAYLCDNDVVDHQVVAAKMENGVTASLTMTAFDYGRSLDVHGTLGLLRGGTPYVEAGAPELFYRDHFTGETEPVDLPKPADDGYAGHGGGDYGLIDSLEKLFRGPNALPPGLDGIAGHRLAFLAEKARAGGAVV